MHISTVEQLDEVITDLHDCPFDLDRAIFDEATHMWTGFFLRPLWEDPRAEHRGFSILYVRSQLPVVEVTLKVSGVDKSVVADNARIGRYSFNQIEPIPNGVRLHFNENLDIELELTSGHCQNCAQSTDSIFFCSRGRPFKRSPHNKSLDASGGSASRN